MFGDVLRERIDTLSETSPSKGGNNPFWRALRDIAAEDIRQYAPGVVDSINATKIYYEILHENEEKLPKELTERLPSNNQEKYRVKNRNMWSSNALHEEGLGNQPGVKAEVVERKNKKRNRVVYRGEKK